jgi:hypothetical protein
MPSGPSAPADQLDPISFNLRSIVIVWASTLDRLRCRYVCRSGIVPGHSPATRWEHRIPVSAARRRRWDSAGGDVGLRGTITAWRLRAWTRRRAGLSRMNEFRWRIREGHLRSGGAIMGIAHGTEGRDAPIHTSSRPWFIARHSLRSEEARSPG